MRLNPEMIPYLYHHSIVYKERHCGNTSISLVHLCTGHVIPSVTLAPALPPNESANRILRRRVPIELRDLNNIGA